MQKLKFTNLAVFFIFFGASLIEAIWRGNLLGAVPFLALGILSFWVDFGKLKRILKGK